LRGEYREWLRTRYPNHKTQTTQWAQAQRIEKYFGDLDEAYDKDKFAAIRASLTYSAADARAGEPNPSPIPIDGDLYKNLNGYRGSLGFYTRFRGWEANTVGIDAALLNKLKAQFLAHCRGFKSFQDEVGVYWTEERAYKNELIASAQKLLPDAALSDEALGAAFLELMRRPPANFINWRAFKLIENEADKPRSSERSVKCSGMTTIRLRWRQRRPPHSIPF
jgi:hypothetical protein